jgi:hypothetical protein
VQGAKAQSFEHDNPRPVLIRIVENNPKADESKLFGLFKAEVERSPNCMAVIIEYWFRNNYASLLRRRTPPAELRAHTKAVKGKILGRMLDLILPNGKRLAEATGSDCIRAGGWLKAVGEKVGARQVVGKVLGEEDLRQLFERGRR